ncbi:hypothetical protein ML436_04190 [Staphylococcus roterodami]|nr:hypothetical protein ML436_04190 [Staphylococcus roterodami]
MKRKLFIVSMGVIFATQLMNSSNAKAMITESVETNFVVKDQDINKILQTQTEITTEQQIIVKEYTQKNKLKSLSSDNIIEYDLHTNQAGGKSGMLYGYSENDSSHFTDRDKRAIRRDHVKEAQNLVENYKDTQTAQDRVKAKQKVNTLSKPHQKYFNKQIDKVYNGLQR